VIEQQGILGAILGVCGLIFGGWQTKRKQQIEAILAEQKVESEAIKSANTMIITLTEAYKFQHEEITQLKDKLHEIEKEVEQCRDDRHILMRIIQDNEHIDIRDEDKQRLGIQ